MVSKLLAFAAGALLPACQSQGEVRLDLHYPDSQDLAPITADVGQVTLVTYGPDEAPVAETRQLLDAGEPLDMGRIAVGDGMTLALQLRAPNQRLLAYGRSPDALDVAADQVITVPVLVRKPYAYLTGHTRLAAFDTTRDATASTAYRGWLNLSRAPVVAASTQDGAFLVVLSADGVGSQMTLLSTSTHTEAAVPPVPLPAPAVGVAVSPDSRWVVVGHNGGGGGVSIIDLVAAAQGTSDVQMVAAGNVGEVAIGDRSALPRAVALLDRADAGCTGSSSLAVIDLEARTVGKTIPLGSAVRDLALSGDGRTAVVATCGGELRAVAIDEDVNPNVMLTQLVGASAVAVFDDRVWGVGAQPPGGGKTRRLLLVSIALDGSGETRLELPPAQERAQSTDFSADGQSAEQRMDADALDAYDLALVPGADEVAILTTAYYHASEVGDFLGAPIIPEMTLTAYEYLLVEASSNAVVQRVRTACELDWVSDPFNPPVLDSWVCTQAAGQDVSEEPYHPRQVSILYGTR
jgi:hypothetical protein